MTTNYSPYVMGLGAINSAFSSYISAKNQKNILKHQSAMAEINARLSELSAQGAMMQGQHQVMQLTMRAGQLMGKQRAAMGASGTKIDRQTLADAELLKDIDKGTILYNADMSAWGHRVEGMNYVAQSRALSSSAGAVSPAMAGITSLLGGATQVAASWYALNPQNTTPSSITASGGSQPAIGMNGGTGIIPPSGFGEGLFRRW
ncbi:MAG: hypothetical protein LBE22_10350 [Azoarcus sp.]|jgi:hypothetical protein|nr:hypothetical protein [Azoarcus sp.]